MLLIIAVGIVGACIGAGFMAALSAGKTEDLESELIGLKAELALRPKPLPPCPVWDLRVKRWRDANTGQWVKHGRSE